MVLIFLRIIYIFFKDIWYFWNFVTLDIVEIIEIVEMLDTVDNIETVQIVKIVEIVEIWVMWEIWSFGVWLSQSVNEMLAHYKKFPTDRVSPLNILCLWCLYPRRCCVLWKPQKLPCKRWRDFISRRCEEVKVTMTHIQEEISF